MQGGTPAIQESWHPCEPESVASGQKQKIEGVVVGRLANKVDS